MPASSTLPTVGMSISLPLQNILLITFLVVLAIYIIFSVILHYHWAQYSSSKRMTMITLLVYAATTLPIIILLGILALTI